MGNLLKIIASVLFVAALGALVGAGWLGREVARAQNRKLLTKAARLERQQQTCLRLAPYLTGGGVGVLAAIAL